MPAAERWLIADRSEVRKPHAQVMPHLMRVKDLAGSLGNGYRTLNGLGSTPNRRGVFYHRRFSAKAPGFVSEPHAVQQALQTVSQAIAPRTAPLGVTWIVDAGFDAVAVWRTVWEQAEHVLCRVKHTERLLAFPARAGQWSAGNIAHARQQFRQMGTAETLLVVHRGRQHRPKAQPVPLELWACPVRLRYATNVRRPGAGEEVAPQRWLVEVRLPDTTLEPWRVMTDWPVVDESSAVRIVRMERQRWAGEDRFKFTKDCLGWEAVQVLPLEAVRMLVALAWVAAGCLYALGVTLEWAEVYLVARRGGWVPHKDRQPGTITLTRGVRRLVELLTTEASLTA